MSPPAPTEPNVPNARLLVVDDEAPNRMVLSRGLARRGFAVDTAEDAAEALAMLEQAEYDLVLLDHVLPGMTGLELLRLLRGSQATAQLPVIMVTAVDDHATIVDALNEGADDYLVQPVETSETVARVQAQLARLRDGRGSRPARASEAAWEWDAAECTVRYSPQWHALLGLPPEPRHGDLRTWLDRIHPQDLLRVRREWKAHLDGITPQFRSEHRLRLACGEYRWVECRAQTSRGADGGLRSLRGTLADIGERKTLDPLTGLDSRMHFLRRVAESLAADARGLVVLLDLDDFRALNARAGSGGADEILVEVAGRLREAVMRHPLGAGATLARIGGDEFAILAGCNRDTGFLQALLEIFRSPISLGEESLAVTGCAGATVLTAGADADQVLRDAALALQQAQAEGRLRARVFEPGFRDRDRLRQLMARDLRFAVERRQLVAVYQPLVDLRRGSVHGFEALLRWRHPELGMVSPADFIPFAEQTGLIVAMGEWILREACHQLRSWQRGGARGLRMSVNLSVCQLADPALPRAVREVLRDTGVAPESLALELTESSLLHGTQAVRETLRELHRLGVRLLLDDFGTGYAGLSYLNMLRFDGIKIDRSFVTHMETDSGSLAIVRTIAGLAKDLEMVALPEGIETREQLRLLLNLGCETGQGFFYSRPVEAPEAEVLLRRGFAPADPCPPQTRVA